MFQPENCITTYEPHAYVVIYSVAEKETMLAAEETLQFLWKSASVGTKAVILVGNKTDLVRSRAVTTDGELVFYSEQFFIGSWKNSSYGTFSTHKN